MYAVLGTLENLCELDNKAKEIISTLDKPISLAFDVKDGPNVRHDVEKLEGTEGDKVVFDKVLMANGVVGNPYVGNKVEGVILKCQEIGVEPSGSLFIRTPKEIEDVVNVCRELGIEITVKWGCRLIVTSPVDFKCEISSSNVL